MAWSRKGISLDAPPPLAWPIKGCCWRPFGDDYGWGAIATGILLAAILPRSRPESRDSYPTSEVASHFVAARAGSAACDTDPRLSLRLIQRAFDHSRVATRCKLSFERTIRRPFGAVGVLFAPIARKIGDRRGPYTVIRLKSAIAMLAVVDDQEKLSIRGGFCRTIARFRGGPPRVRARRSREEAGWTGSIASPPTFLLWKAASFVSLRLVDSRARTRSGSCRDPRPALA
jgi:hypothetical protein